MTVRMLRLRLAMRLGLLSPLVRLARWANAETALEDGYVASRGAHPAPATVAQLGPRG